MTKNDCELIRKAMATDCTNWFDVCDLEEQAESKEAKEELATIRKRLFHEEEGYAGLN